MKKTLSLILSAALVLCLFTGCGAGETAETGSPSPEENDGKTDLLSVYDSLSDAGI